MKKISPGPEINMICYEAMYQVVNFIVSKYNTIFIIRECIY